MCRFVWRNDLKMWQFYSREQRSNYLFVGLFVWKFGIEEFKTNMETLSLNNYTFPYLHLRYFVA